MSFLKQIGKSFNHCVYHSIWIEWMFNDTPAWKLNQLLGVEQKFLCDKYVGENNILKHIKHF